MWPVVTAAFLILSGRWIAADEPPVSAIITTASARTAYLASATIWKDPGDVTPDDLRVGPSGVFPYSAADALDGIDCTFLKPGKDLGGKSAKFLCDAGNGRVLRLKYWDPEHSTGNREVFAMVAATRLMWALGFHVLHALPVNVRCSQCPANPMTGDGPRAARLYATELSQYPPAGPIILSRADRDQGWSWRELDDAIRALPPGPDRTRQRMHFDALTLLGVLMQHGDRKPEQQVLYCEEPADLTAGERRISKSGDMTAVLEERPPASACPTPAVAMVDVGATFGGAGRTSSGESAKMDLAEWQQKTIFKANGSAACRAQLTVSLAAGRDGEGDPQISEDGRRFLLDQLHRLTPAHLQAIFSAARVDLLSESTGKSPRGTTIDKWVAAFEQKVKQIESRHCESAK